MQSVASGSGSPSSFVSMQSGSRSPSVFVNVSTREPSQSLSMPSQLSGAPTWIAA